MLLLFSAAASRAFPPLPWRGLAWLVALGCAGLTPSAFAQATPLADATALKPGSIEGTVVRAADGQPIAGARVSVVEGEASTISEADGRYRLTGISAGSHTLSVSQAECAPLRVVDLVVRPGQPLALAPLALVWVHPADRTPQEYVVEAGHPPLVFPYKRWSVTGPVLDRGARGAFDEVAVKNPTIVQHNGRWHLFYTSKSARDASGPRTALGYVTAPTFEGLRTAPRLEMRRILGESIVAPQVFYFAPQRRWYLIGQAGDASSRALEPVYSTNDDIEQASGWSPPQRLVTGRERTNDLWIDFWVICDAEKAHLFYADQTGALYRMESPLAEFPQGFARAAEQKVLDLSGRNARGKWRFYDACHVYYVESAKKYLALLEGAYAHPTRKNYFDGRNRFLLAVVADHLEGPWRRVEANKGEFIGEARWLFDAEGKPAACDSVSHPELIRAGFDQRLAIADFRLQMLFQTFDAAGIPPTYDYHALPWRLMLMRNY